MATQPIATKPVPEELNLIINGSPVKINWKDVPELVVFKNAIAAEVSATEKNKLHHKFEEMQRSIEALKEPGTTGGITKDELSEAIRGIINTELPTVLKSLIQSEVAPIVKFAMDADKISVAAYRNKIIAEKSDFCLPELVQGETKEQLDAAMEHSIKMCATYFPGGRSKYKPVETTQAAITLTPEQQEAARKAAAESGNIAAPANVQQPGKTEQPATSAVGETIKNTSVTVKGDGAFPKETEWSKKRDEIEANLRKEFAL